MNLSIRNTWRSLVGRKKSQANAEQTAALPNLTGEFYLDLDLQPSDPILAFLLRSGGAVDIETLEMDSPALQALKAAGVKITVPLISQGELVGLLNLGPRRSEQGYSPEDHRLLNSLASQAASSLRVAQLVRQQRELARERERLEQELRVARTVQETLLPQEMPSLPGWQFTVEWKPARVVSGDFYDFIHFPDGQIGLLMADVSGKGMPAALIMANARGILYGSAERFVYPGNALKRANDLLCPDLPANMFVSCLYAVLDPKSGRLVIGNAGYNLPFQCTQEGVIELWARGMPLGLLPDMIYEEVEAHLDPGDRLLIYSDGLVEAHNPQGEIFGFARLRDLLAERRGNQTLELLDQQLKAFTGPSWDQEDDVTLLLLERSPVPAQPQAALQDMGDVAKAQGDKTQDG